MVEDAQRSQRVVVVEKRFSLPHGDDIAHPLSHVFLGYQNLVDHFPNRKIARESFMACLTERTLHGASYLGGETHRQPFAHIIRRLATGRHCDRFNPLSVFAFQHVLPRTIVRYLLVDDGGNGQGIRSVNLLRSERERFVIWS